MYTYMCKLSQKFSNNKAVYIYTYMDKAFTHFHIISFHSNLKKNLRFFTWTSIWSTNGENFVFQIYSKTSTEEHQCELFIRKVSLNKSFFLVPKEFRFSLNIKIFKNTKSTIICVNKSDSIRNSGVGSKIAKLVSELDLKSNLVKKLHQKMCS